MTWFRDNLRVIVTVLLFAVTALAGVRAELKAELDKKADCVVVTRELDQIHTQLQTIDAKLTLLLHEGEVQNKP